MNRFCLQVHRTRTCINAESSFSLDIPEHSHGLISGGRNVGSPRHEGKDGVVLGRRTGQGWVQDLL